MIYLLLFYVIFRLWVDRAEKLYNEVDRAAQRLEALSEKRRERLRELARIRALEDETSQVSFYFHIFVGIIFFIFLFNYFLKTVILGMARVRILWVPIHQTPHVVFFLIFKR